MELGINVLKLPKHIIDAAMYRHSKDIQDTALDVLSEWMKRQENNEVAYRRIVTGLQQREMNHLAAELRTWVEGGSIEPLDNLNGSK